MDKGELITPRNQFKEEIVRVLSRHPEGRTIYQLANALKANRQTISKYVYALTELGFVEQSEVGRAKLCFLKKRERR